MVSCPEGQLLVPPCAPIIGPDPRSGFGARFLKGQKSLYWSRGGGKVWTKSWLKWLKLLFSFILIYMYLFSLTKTETGAKMAPRVTKLGYFDGRAPKLSSRVTLATSGAAVVCHMWQNALTRCRQYIACTKKFKTNILLYPTCFCMNILYLRWVFKYMNTDKI